MGKISYLWDRFEEAVIALLLGGMTLLTFSQVVARYVFNSGADWAFELTTVMFGWLIFFGMAYGVKVGAHIGIDAAVKLLPRDLRRWVAMAGAALCFVYAAAITWGGYKYVDKLRVIGIEMEDLPIAKWIPLAVLPIGFALLAARFLQMFVVIAMGRRHDLGLADEAADAMKLDASRLKDAA